MTINKRKKNSRQRGSKTHGYGSMKKHRGAGNRGGKGMAGTGKRADQYKSWVLKEYGNSYFGKRGFKRDKSVTIILKTINIGDIQENLEKLKKQGKIEEKNNEFIIDIKKLGYDKVLGKGKLTKKLIITAQFFSEKAIKKIEKAGGKAISSIEKVEE